MSVRTLCLILSAGLLFVPAANAQSEARIKIVQPGVNRLEEDLKYLIELSPTPALKKQWKTVKDNLIDNFTPGIDVTQPIRIDVVFGKKSLDYEMHFPVTKLGGKGGFLLNIGDLGYKNKQEVTGLYSLTESAKGKPVKLLGYLRDANKYGSIAPTKEAVPANLAHPINEALKAYLAKGYDFAAELKNDPADKKGLADRQANFKELRTQLEAGIKFKRDEDKNTFEVRKLTVVQNLAEAERFLVETELLTMGWTTDVALKEGRGEFSFAAIPETSLHASAALLGAKPSHFAHVKAPEKTAATGRINFAIDALRAEHLKNFYKAFRPVLAARFDSSATLKDADQKTAAKQAGNLLIDMLDASIAIGALDGCFDLTDVGDGKHGFLGGIRAADGKVADQILGLFPKLLPGHEVALNVATVGETGLHTLKVPAGRLPQFQKFFPGETVVYLATSKDVVWLAIGPNAQADLTAAITAVAGPAAETPDTTILSFSANMAQLVEFFDALAPEKAETKESKTADQKEQERLRTVAEQAVAGCEPRLTTTVKRNGNVIEATSVVSECALKFVGTMIADQVKKYLE